MGTAWPQKYHSSRGHASAILAQTQTFSHVATANATTQQAIVERSVQCRRPPSPTRSKPTRQGIADTFSHGCTTKSESNGGSGAAGADLYGGPVDVRSSNARQAQYTCVVTDASHVDETCPVAAELPLCLWWLLLVKAIFSTLNSPGHCWSRSPAEGWPLATAGDQESIKALRQSSAAAQITTTTMNASNQVTLNRFIRLTVTLLITRTLLLRRLVLATAVVALLSDRNQTNKIQPNAAIVISTVRRRRCRLRLNWPQPYDYSNCCWSSSCRHPLPYSAASASATTVVAIISHSVPRRQLGDDKDETGSYSPSSNLVRLVTAVPVVAVMKEVAAKTAKTTTMPERIPPETNSCFDEEVADGDGIKCGHQVQAARRSQPAGFRKWSDFSCQHYSLLTCSRFSMESVIKRSCPGVAVPRMVPSAPRCSPTRRTIHASVCTSS